jgi:hypothetical protein
MSKSWPRDSNNNASGKPGAVQTSSVPLPVQRALVYCFLNDEAGQIRVLDQALRIIRKLSLDDSQRELLAKVARVRLKQHDQARRAEHAVRYLAVLLFLEPDRAIDELIAWIGGAPEEVRHQQAIVTLGALFDRHHPLISGLAERASVQTLDKLLQIAYANVRPEDDAVHEGSYTPDARDHAEEARNTILSALIDRPGADAFRAMLRAASHPIFKLKSARFRELARGKAERDSERPPWTMQEVLAFERQRTAPVKTGADLLRLVMAILDDINFALTKGEASSRSVLARAGDEDEVQNWLVEQLNLRSKERYLAYREAEVAMGDKPDVIVSSNSANCEVAIEVKHGGKGWSARELEHALRTQLAEDYLKPPTRRHGVLVITHHRNRKWHHPKTNTLLEFDALIVWLSGIAGELVEKEVGAIEVRCAGINAWEKKPSETRPPEKGIASAAPPRSAKPTIAKPKKVSRAKQATSPARTAAGRPRVRRPGRS